MARTSLVVVLVTALAGVVTPALAKDRRAAQAAMRLGNERFAEHTYEEARRHFEAAMRADATPEARWMLGRCDEQLGAFGFAATAFKQVAESRGASSDLRAAASVRADAMRSAADGVEALEKGNARAAAEAIRGALKLLRAGEWAEKYPAPAALQVRLGDAHRAAGDLAAARKDYERAFGREDAGEQLKADLREKIAAVDADLAAREAAAKDPAKRQPGPVKPRDPAPDSGTKPDESIRKGTDPAGSGRTSAGSGRGRAVGAVVTGALGAVGLGLGAIFAIESSAAWEQVDSATRNSDGRVIGMTQQRAFERADRADKYATLSWLAYGVGAASAGTAIVLAILSGRQGDGATASVTPSRGGALLTVAF